MTIGELLAGLTLLSVWLMPWLVGWERWRRAERAFLIEMQRHWRGGR